MEIVRHHLTDLSLDPANARLHDERSITTLMASLRRFGQQGPVKIDRQNVVRAGNGLVIAAQRLGWDEIDTVISDLTGPDLAAYALTDNRSAELSRWDYEQLSVQLQSLQDEGWALNDLGWADHELEPILSADWTPQAVQDKDDPFQGGGNLAKPIIVTLDQRVVIDQAVTRVRTECDDDQMSEGRCLELICANFLQDPNFTPPVASHA